MRGVRTHNLKDIDLDIPHGRLVVITGPSGSGKSSLAFDTIFAEGQRQFIDSLSIEARQYFDQVERPDVDLVEGLQPTICIDQRRAAGNPRSTVATMTEIYDHLRLLMARAGEVHCSKCGAPIRRSSATQIQKWVEQLPEGTRLMLLAPLVRNEKGDHQTVIDEIRKHGFVRARIDGQLSDVEQVEPLNARQKHSIDAVIDRLIVRGDFQSRLAESIRHALQHGHESLTILYESGNKSSGNQESDWIEQSFSTRFACTACQIAYDEIEPRSFSFNSPYGACESCNGLGLIEEFDADTIIPNWDLPLKQNAVKIWKLLPKSTVTKQQAAIAAYFEKTKFEPDQPLSQLTDKQRAEFLRGDGKQYLGLLTLLEKEFVTTTETQRLEQLSKYRGENICSACQGSRLREQSNHVMLGGKNIRAIVGMTISQSLDFFQNLKMEKSKRAIAERVIPEIVRRLQFLQQVGAEYLTLGRSVATLSGGEFQRVRLATGIGSGLAGICYILDEPSIGLHQRDNERLIDALRNLQKQGNTLLVVEHDEAMMRQAEYLIDIGPEAGVRGGEILAAGTLDEVLANAESSTTRFLTGKETIEIPARRREASNSNAITIEGARANNLQSVNVSIPLNTLTCVTGVSGSGKSSLINATLIPALNRRLGGTSAKCGEFDKLKGTGNIKAIVEVNQSPIGRSPRSNAATYTGLFDEVRKLFAASRQAKQLGFGISRFSFNASSGRCESCQGYGAKKIEMSFLPDMQVTCEACNGKRFNRQTLQVKFKGKSIADVLDMSIDTAVEFFENHEKILIMLRCLQDVGLGYLPLGQPANTISGGEGQRIKLATNLARASAENTIYFLDEPTTGLHFVDVKRLLAVLQRLVEKGNTVVVIEHNLDVIKQADWVIDLGPDGGSNGGHVVVAGAPEVVAKNKASHTGHYLQGVLS